jgi:hypothetical protein
LTKESRQVFTWLNRIFKWQQPRPVRERPPQVP